MGFKINRVWSPYNSESSQLEVIHNVTGLFVGSIQYWVCSDHEYNDFCIVVEMTSMQAVGSCPYTTLQYAIPIHNTAIK